MAQRGRKSRHSLGMQRIGGERPPAPEDMNEFQRKVWTEIVDTKPPDWFGKDTQGMLREYCEAMWTIQQLTRRINVVLEDPQVKIRDVKDWLAVRNAERAKAIALARSMRLTHQSQYDPETAKRRSTPKGAKPPWEE